MGWTYFVQQMDHVIIKNMLTSIYSWKHLFFKACPTKGYLPFYMDNNHMPHYLEKWTPPKKHRDEAFKKLSLCDQNNMAKLLAMVLFNIQALICEFQLNCAYVMSSMSCISNLCSYHFYKLLDWQSSNHNSYLENGSIMI